MPESITEKDVLKPALLSIQLQAHNIQTSQQLPDGGYILRMEVKIPPGLLRRSSGILNAVGTPINALQGAVAGVPSALLILRTEKMTEEAVQAILGQTEASVDE